MANRFWVGGTGNWDATVGTKWATTSGGAGGAAVPTSADDVYLDANSGAVTVTNSASAAINCQSLDFTGFTGTFNLNTGQSLYTYGTTIKLVADMTWTQGNGSYLVFGGSGTINFTTAGKSLGHIQIGWSGSTGTVVAQDSWASVGPTQAVNLSTGTLNTNSQTMTWGSFSSNNSNARTLTMGASAITVTGTVNNTWVGTSSMTITANTAIVTMTGASATIGGASVNWNGMSMVCTGSGTFTFNSSAITMANFTRTGTAVKTDGLRLASGANALTVTGTLTLGGNTTQGVNRLLVDTGTSGTQRSFTAAAYVITGDVDFMDINLAYSGGASWTNAGSAYIGDALGNAGAVTTNATVSATQTATGTASFTWSTHGWTTRVPLPQDDVVINNAFVAGRTATMDMPRAGRDLTFSCTGNPTWSMNPAQAYGSLTLASGMLTSGYNGGTLSLWGRSTHTITTNLVAVNFPLQVNGAGALVGGKYTLQDNLNIPTLNFSVRGSGSLDANNKDVICGSFDANTNTTHIVAMGSGTWTLAGQSGNANIWIVNASGMTLTGSAIINITYNGASAMNFVGAGLSYGTLRHTATGSAALTITGNNTFAALDLECTTARTITFPSSGTQTITGTLTLLGAAGQLLSLRSSSTGTKWYINAATTSAQYCDVKDCTATGTGTPIDNSTGGVDSGNNIGWLFVAGGAAGYSSTLLTLGVG